MRSSDNTAAMSAFTSRPTPITRTRGQAVLMVHATSDAEGIAQKSGLGVVDLLRPFTDIDQDFQLTTVGGQQR